MITPMMAYILALDQGTTSSRAILFDHTGAEVALAQEEFPQLFPRPGWVEHDPDAIWESQLRTARAVLTKAGVGAGQIAALGITNQRETTILWDRATGRPIHHALVWQDRRTADYCRSLHESGDAERVRNKTGLVVDAYFAASKIRWLLDEIPGARDRALRGELAFGTVDTWLIWNLTGGRLHLTDVSNACRTMLLNLRSLDWDPELLDLFDIPASLLPEVCDSSGILGECDAALLGAPVKIGGIAGDQQAALFGQACHRPGMAKNTYGTGCFLLMNTGIAPVESSHRLLSTVAWRIAGKTEYALEGSVFIAGAAVQWLRDQLGLFASAAEIEALAASVPDSGGVVFVPAFAGLGAPHWDPYARGTLLGLTRGSHRGHIARATLEAIACQSAEVLHAMEQDSGIRLEELRVDGGATRNHLLMQIQSDLLGVPVVRSAVAETTAQGAAYLAGLASGVWSSREEIAAQWAESGRYLPMTSRSAAVKQMATWSRAVDRAKGWADGD